MYFKTSDNVKLYYEINGKGTPLVMLNGLFGDTSSWSKQVDFFSKKYQCIRLDHRGMANSERWQGKYSYELHARDVYELLNYLNIDKCHILGVCHGGMVAVTFVKNYPERVYSIVVNGALILKSERQRQLFVGWKLLIENAGFELFFKTLIMPVIFSDNFITHNINKIDEFARSYNSKVEIKSTLKLIDACCHYGFEENEIKNINVPALVMSGDEDCYISKTIIENYTRIWKASEYHNFKSCGHYPQKEATEEYNKIVNEFLLKQDRIREYKFTNGTQAN